jgi:hypothetical protein
LPELRSEPHAVLPRFAYYDCTEAGVGAKCSSRRWHDALGSEEFTERKKVAIHWAEVMTLNAHGFSDAEFARLRSFYSEGEVVE